MNRLWLYVLVASSCALLQACGSGSSNPTPPVQQPQISIKSPTDGSTVTTLPTTIQVSFTDGADPTAMKALLDGVDITAQFAGADSSGTRSMQVDRPALNLGKNQIQVIDGTLQASASFTVSFGGLGSGQSASLPLLVPIQTRYVTGDGSVATDYNIALYEDPNNPNTPTLFPAQTPSDGSNTGFQIVYLLRSNLSLVQNSTVPNQNPSGQFYANPLYVTLTNVPTGCGSGGCLVIVQSLGELGYTPCANYNGNNNTFIDCLGFQELFQRMGGSARWLFANGTNQQIAYSFVGNTNPGGPNYSSNTPGTFFERLTCSGSNTNNNNPCDYLGSPNTSGTAPGNATPSQIGNMAGVLIRDNFNNFTYAQNAPPVSFSSGLDNANVSHNFTINGVTIWSDFFGTGNGGFHVVVLDRTTLNMVAQASFKHDPAGNSDLPSLQNFVNQYNTYGNLILLAAFANTTYTTNTANRAAWYSVAHNSIPQLGGTEQVFYLMNNQEHCSSQPPPPCQMDDYTLVGGFTDQLNTRVAQTGLENEVSAEMSSVIARETEATPLDSTIQGFLEMDHEGYYSAKQFGHATGLSGDVGLSNPINAELLSASLRNPTPWPYASDPGKQAAYTWISQQLCCNDVRSAYVNLNIDPSIWLAQLQQLTFDPTKIPASDQADFDTMKQQLTTEFQYVKLVRLFQGNLLGLYQDQQANLSLLLQQATNDVLSDLQIQLTQTVPSQSWSTTLEQVFGVASALAGFIPEASTVTAGVQTALALGTAAMNEAAAYTNSAGGQALKAQENEEVQASDLAGNAADEFASTLVTLGNEFDRIVSDWGRLKTVGGPLLNDQVPWDSNAAGLLLRSYDRLVRRDLYTKLIMANAQVAYFPYISDESYNHNSYGSYDCTWSQDNIDPYWQLATQPFLFYPSGAANTDNLPNNRCCNYPHDYDWAMWALVFPQNLEHECPVYQTQPSTFGLFQPLDPNNQDALGAYRLWFFTREGYMINQNNSQQPCYDGSGC